MKSIVELWWRQSVRLPSKDIVVSTAMRQPDPEAIEKRPRGGTRGFKEDVEMRAAVEDILSGNADILLRDLNAELRSRLPKKACIREPQRIACVTVFSSR